MTQYEFFKAVAEADVNEEILAYAKEAIAKADAARETRKNTPSKARVENEALVPKLMEVLNETPMMSSEIAEVMELTRPKVQAIINVALDMGEAITIGEGKGKSGKVKTYSI